MINAKFQTYDNVAKSRCCLCDFAEKRNSRDFAGKMNGSGQVFNRYKFVIMFSKSILRNAALVYISGVLDLFLAYLEHILSQKVGGGSRPIFLFSLAFTI